MKISASMPAEIAERMSDRTVVEDTPVDLDPAVRIALTYPTIIWEGLGVEGVQYPFPDNSLDATPEQRRDLARRRNDFDKVVAIHLAHLAVSGDLLELGRLQAEQLIGHVRRVVEAERTGA